MSLFARTHNAAPVLALAAALFLCGCGDDSEGNYSRLWLPADSRYNYASDMTQTQTAAASDGPITVDATTKSLVISGAKGKTIYMARTNPTEEAIYGENTRAAVISSGAAKTAAFGGEDSEKQKLEFSHCSKKSPHKKLYDKFMSETQGRKSASKSAAPVQKAVKNYSVGDTENFYSVLPATFASFITIKYKLLVAADTYNIWVDSDDKYYKKDMAKFTEEAEKLGKIFINGYGLVSHIFGQPSDQIYQYSGSERVVYGPMSELSKTGTKINIMFYDLLEEGDAYGYVYNGDNYEDYEGSNMGRFLYLDSQTLINDQLEQCATAIHEFTHTIVYNHKTLKNGEREAYWYGELLAMMSEDMMQAYLGIDDSEIDKNLKYTPKFRLAHANYDSWMNGITGDDSAAYAAIFQFGAWLSRNFGGVKFIKELARNNEVDMDSIIAAVKALSAKQYTVAELFQKMAGDMQKEEAGKGFNQNAPTYAGTNEFTCQYTDKNGAQKTYLYPITAINLWEPFYAWCDTWMEIADSVANKSVPYDSLPNGNGYKIGEWSVDKAYLGPAMFKRGTMYANLRPYANMLLTLGTAASDSVTIDFECVGGNFFGDTVTIWAK